MRNIPQRIFDRVEESNDSFSEVRKMLQWIQNADSLDTATVNRLLQQLKGSKGKLRLLQHTVLMELQARIVEMLHVQKKLLAEIADGAIYSSMDKQIKQLESVNKFISESMDVIAKSVGVPESQMDMMDTLEEQVKGKAKTEFEDLPPEGRERLRQALEDLLSENKPAEPVTFGNE